MMGNNRGKRDFLISQFAMLNFKFRLWFLDAICKSKLENYIARKVAAKNRKKKTELGHIQRNFRQIERDSWSGRVGARARGRQTLRAFGLALFDIEKIVFYCYFISNVYRSGGIFTLTSASRMPPPPSLLSVPLQLPPAYNNFMLSPPVTAAAAEAALNAWNGVEKLFFYQRQKIAAPLCAPVGPAPASAPMPLPPPATTQSTISSTTTTTTKI